MGLLFVVLGNLLPQTRPSFFAGIRTPWTLTDRDNWIATDRFGGRTMKAGVVLVVLAAEAGRLIARAHDIPALAPCIAACTG